MEFVKRLIFWHNRHFSTTGKWLAPRCSPRTSGRTRVGYRQIKGKIMKEGIHPNYREVLFVDMSNDFKFVTRSTIQTRETAEFNGQTYPLAKIEVSSESHPFYTGQQRSWTRQAASRSSTRSSVRALPARQQRSNTRRFGWLGRIRPIWPLSPGSEAAKEGQRELPFLSPARNLRAGANVAKRSSRRTRGQPARCNGTLEAVAAHYRP